MGYEDNLYVLQSPGKFSRICAYIAIVQGFVILGHSFHLHRFRWHSVRIVSDLCALFSLFFCLTIFYKPLGRRVAVICIFFVYLFDSLIFINRYFAVKKKSHRWVKILVYLFLSLQFVLWAPLMLFMPITTDLTTEKNKVFISRMIFISVFIKLVFSTICSIVFFLLCREHWRKSPEQQRTSSSQVMYIVSIKAIIHFFISVVLNFFLFAILNREYRALAFLLTPTQLHFLFNYKIENNPAVRKLLAVCFTKERQIEPMSISDPDASAVVHQWIDSVVPTVDLLAGAPKLSSNDRDRDRDRDMDIRMTNNFQIPEYSRVFGQFEPLSDVARISRISSLRGTDEDEEEEVEEEEVEGGGGGEQYVARGARGNINNGWIGAPFSTTASATEYNV